MPPRRPPRSGLRLGILALVAVCGCLAHSSRSWGPHVPEPKLDVADARTHLDAYIDARFEATRDDTDALVTRLIAHGVDAARLEALLRGPRATYPAPRWTPGTISDENPITCFHVDYTTVYYAYVPPTLDRSRPAPVLVVGHGGNSNMPQEYARGTAKRYMGFYQGLADAMGAVMVAPASERGWSPIGDSLIFSVLSDVQRSLPVDPDRIFLTGQSMGGHLAWRTAMTYADRFAAFAPMSGGYAEWTDNGALFNLWDTVGYHTWGQEEPYGLDVTNAKLHAFFAEHGYRWTGVQVPGEHPIADGEFAHIAAAFAPIRRDLYGPQLYFRGTGAMQYTGNWTIEGWPTHTIRLDRPLRSNLHGFVALAPRTDDAAAVQELRAVVRPGNRVELTTNRVRHVTVMLHPAMGLDLTRPVTITVNGSVAFAGSATPDLGRMLDLVRETDDRGRIFHAFVELDVTSDREVGAPWAPTPP